MARFLNSKSMAGFLVIFWGFFASNTWAATTVEGAKLKSGFERKTPCYTSFDCQYSEHCYLGYCEPHSCDYDEIWDSFLGKCRDRCNGVYDHWDGSECITCEWDERYDVVDEKCKDDGTGLAVGIIVALAVVIPVIIIASICACCCCCAGCAGHAYRQRRNKNNQMQIQPQTVFVQQQHPGYPGQYGNNSPPNAQAQPPAHSPPNHGVYPQQPKY